MEVLAGGEFFELSHGRTVPPGLVSDPPDYGGCVARLEAAAKAPPVGGGAKPTAAGLLSKCRELYQAFRLQTMSFLVYSRWLAGVLGEQGVRASDGEARQQLQQLRAKQFPKESELQQFLASRRRSVADELLLIKLDLLSRNAAAKLKDKQAVVGLTEAGQRWTAKTSCLQGYVVQHCKQYTPSSTSTMPPSSILIEQVATITGSRCVNRPACG
jgi:hypothetical protein